MLLDQETLRFIFGLKLRSLRERKKLSLKSLARLSGLSPSYINEIEKGKKYPKTEKIILLSKALDANYDDLISLKLTNELSSISDILGNNLLHNLPLEVFGIHTRKLFEQMAEKPLEFSALISAILEITRNYKVKLEDFFFATLRAYIDMHNNYFPELEEKVDQFKQKYGLNENNSNLDNFLTPQYLINFLEEQFHYRVILKDFSKYPDAIGHLYFFYHPGKRPRFYVNQNLSQRELTFILVKELAHAVLKIEERFSNSHMTRLETFGQVYNNFQASYFASALILPRQNFIKNIENFFNQEKWNPEKFSQLAQSYPGTYESFFHRLSQILPSFFGIDQIFYLRFHYNTTTQDFALIKELHLSELHTPHIVKVGEHYCRRLLTATLLEDIGQSHVSPLAGAQRSMFWNSEKDYLCFALAFPLELKSSGNACITLGIQNTEKAKEKIRFFSDSQIPSKEVASTCEQCGINVCEKRVAPARIVEESSIEEKIERSIKTIIQTEVFI